MKKRLIAVMIVIICLSFCIGGAADAASGAASRTVAKPMEYQHTDYPHTIYAKHLVYSDDNSGGRQRNLYHFYYSPKDYILYVIMHGSKDGRTFTGISTEEAVEQLCVRNLEILGDKPFDKVVVVCCYPRYHAGTKYERLSIPIEFISNSPKALMCEMYDDHFIWYECDH